MDWQTDSGAAGGAPPGGRPWVRPVVGTVVVLLVVSGIAVHLLRIGYKIRH